MSVPSRPVNAALSALLAVESAALKVMNMPLGSSLLVLAQKPLTPHSTVNCSHSTVN